MLKIQQFLTSFDSTPVEFVLFCHIILLLIVYNNPWLLSTTISKIFYSQSAVVIIILEGALTVFLLNHSEKDFMLMIRNLKKLRTEKGVSQRQLGEAIGVSQQSINKYENYEIEPDIRTLIMMAQYFDTSVDYLNR